MSRALWKESSVKIKGLLSYVPMLQVKTFKPIFDEQLADVTVEYPETYNIPALLSYVNAVPARAENEDTMSSFLQQRITSVKQGVGRRSARASDMLANLRKKTYQLANHGRLWGSSFAYLRARRQAGRLKGRRWKSRGSTSTGQITETAAMSRSAALKLLPVASVT